MLEQRASKDGREPLSHCPWGVFCILVGVPYSICYEALLFKAEGLLTFFLCGRGWAPYWDYMGWGKLNARLALLGGRYRVGQGVGIGIW